MRMHRTLVACLLPLALSCDTGSGERARSDSVEGAGGPPSLAAAESSPTRGSEDGRRARSSPTIQTELSFEDITARAGLIEPLNCTMGHAVGFGDINGDGWPDLLYGTFASRRPDTYLCDEGPRPDQLFMNAGDGTFIREPSPAVEHLGRASGVAFVDLDGDGDLDGVIAHNGRKSGGPIREQTNVLLRNVGGTLQDVSDGRGLQVPGLSARNGGPFDYDGEGDLDLFIPEDRLTGTGSKLFEKLDEAFAFRDVTAQAGLPADILGFGAAIADVNDDGWSDLYITDADQLFVFDPSEMEFEHADWLDETFDWPRRNEEDWTTGVAFGDLNRDGRLDLVVTHHFDSAHNDPVPPRVYLNRTEPGAAVTFERIDAGVAAVGGKAPHVEIQDMDNDGWPDIYLSVHVDVDGERMPLVFQHNGSATAPRFEANSLTLSPAEKTENYGAAGATADVDRDGRLDMLISEWWPDRDAVLYRNTSRAGNYLEVEVQRAVPNGIGSKVYVYESGQLGDAEALIGLVEISTGFGYSSGQETVAHFGLGERTEVDLRVVLPHGRGNVDLERVKANRRIRVD